MCLNCYRIVTIMCLNICMNIFNVLILLMLPMGIVGWYILLDDPQKSIWERLHRLMKAGRINKVIKKFT